MNPDKRYQVFISSTYVDLQEERREVLRAVLELDHMPAGMELFPATDDSAWDLIKGVIDSSDYYVVIIGGRYGSVDETRDVGYTEKEYDYAIDSGKPVIPLLHRDPNKIPREKTDGDDSAWAKLQAFRQKVQDRHTCSYWNSPENLKSTFIIGLTKTIKLKPATGWVPANQVLTGADLKEVLSLRRRVDELTAELEKTRTTPSSGTEELAQGEDVFELHISFSWTEPDDIMGQPVSRTIAIHPTWNEIFAAVGPMLMNEAAESNMRAALVDHFSPRATKKAAESSIDIGPSRRSFIGTTTFSTSCSTEDFSKCLVQLKTLGLIRQSVEKNRSVKDTATYWTLSTYGEHLLVQLLAQRKGPGNEKEEQVESGDS